jgi:tetratricopeptide (TPR) repeat protein/predicted Ser/Thr protein kinase
MSTLPDSRLLRLAIAKGLLAWEDLDAVADRSPTQPAVSPAERLWVQALIDSGRLKRDDLASLLAEMEAEDDLFPPTLVAAPPGRAGAVAFPPELRFLKDWPRYRVERFLGSGGMGSVYLASDPQLGRQVALKFLHHNDPALVVRFLREARAQARVEHDHLCKVHEVGEVEGRPYIAMQYIEGRSLAELRGRISTETAVRIVRDVARAVHAAHRTGLIHRDLKPANILVGRDDSGNLHPWVVDFGLAQEQGEEGLTRTGLVSGTPAYVSPEQAQGAALDRRTDVYSLGVVLYEMLTESPPFIGPSAAGTLVRVVQDEPEPPRKRRPAIPADLETIVLKCLEKDPARRYESARALAEDLDRWLEGDPIEARPAAWTYRAGKRLRKHRALVAVAAAALLVLVAAGVEVVHTRWQARERARLAQRFSQRIESLEARLRIEAFLPLHDVTAAKRRLRRELGTIQEEMRGLGPIAEGPGHFALGQGYLALHQDELAREHLEKAWNAGERTPEVAAALGRVFSSFLEKALTNPGMTPALDPEQMRSRFRTPALRYLKEAARTSHPPSPYVLALIAFYEGRHPEAVELARQAYREDASLYEAAQLVARVYTHEADDASEADRPQDALRLYDQAGEVYRQLLAVVPSDATLHAADCQLRAHRLQAESREANLSPERFREALQPCEVALRVDPELSDVHTFKSGMFWTRGDRLRRRGGDPQQDFATAIAEARKAIALNPRDSRAYVHLSTAHRLRAFWQLGRGADPGADLRQALQAAEEAVRLEPGLASHYNTLALACTTASEDQERRGVDPRPLLRKAVDSYGRALALNPQYLPSQINVGQTWTQIGEAELARGIDPTKSLDSAIAAFRRAVVLGPQSVPAYNNLGNAHLTLGEYLLARGSDPRPALQAAMASYQKTLEIQPEYAYGPYNLAYTWRLQAQALLDRGEDPGPALATARSWIEASLRINPDDADTFLELGRIELIAARKDGAAAATAETALRRAEALNPGAPEIYLEQARLERWRAQAGLAPEQAVRRGLERAEKALAVNAKDPRALAIRGALLHLAAGLEADPARRIGLTARADASLREAFALNPLLRREYGSLP